MSRNGLRTGEKGEKMGGKREGEVKGLRYNLTVARRLIYLPCFKRERVKGGGGGRGGVREDTLKSTCININI